MELDARDYCRGNLILSQVNKVHHVHTIARVAAMLGEVVEFELLTHGAGQLS